MPDEKLRTRIASEAARLLFAREETDLARAKRRAAIQLRRGGVAPYDLPTDKAVRRELHLLSQLGRRARSGHDRHESRVLALAVMRALGRFAPRLLEAQLIDDLAGPPEPLAVCAFADDAGAVPAALAEGGFQAAPLEVGLSSAALPAATAVFQVERDADAPAPFMVFVVAGDAVDDPRALVDAPGATNWLNAVDLAQSLERHEPDTELHERTVPPTLHPDRFQYYLTLLAPLEHVRQDPRRHPEGDALCHSLQVFELARAQQPYDEELLTAALLHDVGKAIDRRDHVAAALDALADHVTERTLWFIEHHVTALAIRDGTVGARSLRRLEASPDFEDLMLLAECDRRGRRRGVRVPEPEDALDYLRELASHHGE